MTCPICKAPTQKAFRPFCSQHCANIDLGRWFNGQYRTPSFRQDNDEEGPYPPIYETLLNDNDRHDDS